MVLTDSEGKRRGSRVQPTVTTGRSRRSAVWGVAPAALMLLLAGCSDVPHAIDPVSWWHGLEGGAIAQDRPPPPNPHAPFPHLAAAPTRPAGMPDWEWADLKSALTSQGAAAHQYAADNPIPALPQTAASGAPAAAPAAPAKAVTAPAAATATAQAPAQSQADTDAIRRLAAAQGPDGSNAGLPPASTVEAATAATQAPAKAGNGTSVTFGGPDQPQTTSSPGPHSVPVNAAGQPVKGQAVGTNYTFFDPNNGLSVPGATGPVAQPDEAHPPAVPTSVPAPAAVPGFAIPAVPSTYVPPKVLPQPAPYVAPPPLPPVPPVPVAFAPRSAVLTAKMKRALQQLAASHQTARIAVTGYGDASSDALAAQSAAMPLALERARAITVQLMADGLPVRDLVPSAQALGQGGLARLVD